MGNFPGKRHLNVLTCIHSNKKLLFCVSQLMESNIPMCHDGRFFSLTLMLNVSETYTKISTEHYASHLLSKQMVFVFQSFVLLTIWLM